MRSFMLVVLNWWDDFVSQETSAVSGDVLVVTTSGGVLMASKE